jgi:hypothetical protein
MADNFLGDRRKALEDSFFAKQEAKLLEKIRATRAAEESRESLAQTTGIADSAVLDKLEELGIVSDTIAALSLVPLVAVAWADGTVDDKEHNAVLAAAAEVGVNAEHVGYELLEGWLTERPGSDLVETWKAYIQDLTGSLSPTEKSALRDDLIGRARAVAEATGGFLGLGNKISSEESAVLDELEAAFR